MMRDLLLPPATRLPALMRATAAALWLLIVVGGIVRATKSGLGCPDWPLCSGRVVPVSETAPWIEFSHRMTALVTITLLALTAIAAWRARRARPRSARLALGAVALVPAQAILGAIVVWLETPPDVVALHFVIGVTMVALMTAAAVTAGSPAGTPRTPMRRSSAWLLGLSLVTIAAGALVVASQSEFACGATWPDCAGTLVGSGADGHTQGVHRMLAALLAASSIALVGVALRGGAGRALALLLLGAVALQVAAGAGVVLADPRGWVRPLMQALHVAGAATVIVVAVLAGLAVHGRSTTNEAT